ncbi:MAG: hypothetical protein A2293_13265 [Elusimicrobia bacterium RIFOXYB2_FULL_49_7]|nr:MAG: hypothetical protein A2293_13265 [Elusimicrobia bacterium RIFOXYB2_FULL_49_7]
MIRLLLFVLGVFVYGQTDTLQVIAVGDVMFANTGTGFLDRYGIDYPLKQVKSELQQADIRVCNLELPIADTGEAAQKTYTFRAPVRHAGVVLDGGFDVVHLGNNHVLDNGISAFYRTLDVLDSLKVGHIGGGRNLADARKPYIIEKKGLRIGFLGYSLVFPEDFWAKTNRPGTVFGHEDVIRQDMAALRDSVDLLFVVFHWGAEKMTVPKDYQKQIGHLCIDLGADGVFGHHPHVLQGMELYKGKLIAYSLGNFSFATWTNAVWDSAILRCYFSGKEFVKAEVVPLLINNFKVEFQLRILTGADARKSLSGLAALCDSVNTHLTIEGERGFIYPTQE